MGWANSTITGIGTGSIPGGANLSVLAAIEGVNISWLLTGRGVPYSVLVCPTAAVQFEAVKALQDLAPGWAHGSFPVGGHLLRLFWQRARLEMEKGEPLEYVRFAALMSTEAFSLPDVFNFTHCDLRFEFAELEQLQIASGWYGAHQVFRDHPNLLEAVPGPAQAWPVVRETANGFYQFTPPPAPGQERTRLLEMVRALRTEDMRLVMALVDRLQPKA